MAYTRYIFLPDVEDGGSLEAIDLSAVTAVREPTEYTDSDTGEIFELEPGSGYSEVFFRDGKRLCSVKVQMSVADVVKLINQ